jgi:hypothetical protein
MRQCPVPRSHHAGQKLLTAGFKGKSNALALTTSFDRFLARREQ